METNFDAKAGQWDEHLDRHARAKDVADAMKATGIHPDTALEFGCGTGLLTFALRPFATQTVLADTSQGMIDVLNKKILDGKATDLSARLISEDASELSGASFDAIYSLMTLHHIEDTLGALSLFQDLLAPGGTLFICDLDEEDGSFHGDDFSGHCGFNRKALTSQLNAAGFFSVSFNTCHIFQREVNGKPRHFPLFLASAQR